MLGRLGSLGFRVFSGLELRFWGFESRYLSSGALMALGFRICR